MDWTSIVETLGIAGILAFVVKRLIQSWLDKGVERYKQELKSHNDAEIERLRSELRVSAFERETTFAKLHERRAEVIAEIYKRLARKHAAFSDYLSPIQVGSKEEHGKRVKEAKEMGNDFISYFNENQIFLDTKLCAEIDKLLAVFRRIWSESGADIESFKGTKWVETWNDFNEKVPPLRGKIEKQFREMLGILDSKEQDHEEDASAKN